MGQQCLANDVQLAALSDAFRRTHYPSTKERHELAMQLGMTSRSVQIWVRFSPYSFVLLIHSVIFLVVPKSSSGG